MSRKKRHPIAAHKDTAHEEMPGEDTSRDTVGLYLEKAKEIASTFAGIAAIAYALGFLITNVYLNMVYGIYDFALIKARYISTGFTFLLLCFMAAVWAFLLLQIANTETKSLGSRFKKWSFVFFVWLLTSSFSSLSLKTLLVIVEGFRWQAMYELPVTFWFWWAIPYFALHIWFLRRGGLKRSGVPIPVSSGVFTGLVVLAAIYGRFYYPLLPFSLGGGMPISIQMVADEERVQMVQQLVPIERENITETVYLIEQSEKFYFALVGSMKSNSLVRPVEIDKSLIIGIIHPVDVPPPLITHDRILQPVTNINPTVTVTQTVSPSPTANVAPTP